jgi:aryl-alcohol dehydrogenase-like predicted oxidoreductase
MKFRYLGDSGLKVSEICYGNWLTHGSQVENDTATLCVRAALDAGITTFDTADAYANTVAESVLGEALKGERRESLEIFTKVYWPTGPKGPNDSGLSRKHIMESINGSLKRLGTDYVDLYQAHRYDTETPLEETMQAFADVVRAGKALYIGVSEWSADQLRAGHALAKQLGFQLISNQPQYSMLWRVIEAEVVPTSQELGMSQIVWSPVAQGVLTGKYVPGAVLPEGSHRDRRQGRRADDLEVHELSGPRSGPEPEADCRRARSQHGSAGGRLGAAEREPRLRDHRRLTSGAGQGERRRLRRGHPRRSDGQDRRGPR